MPKSSFILDPPHTDVELGFSREPIPVYYALPQAGITPETGVIVHSCEFGARPESMAVAGDLLPELADKYDCVAISPSYFGIMRNEKVDISGVFIHNLNRIYNMSFTQERFASMSNYAEAFRTVAEAVAERGVTSVDRRCQPLAITGRGEYQSWGFLPALDCLGALAATFERHPGLNTRRVFAVGQYYGGYVASLLGKLAPGTFAAVLSKSGYSRVETRHVLCGETLEADMEASFKVEGGKDYAFTIAMCGNNPWTSLDETSPRYFSDACRQIRSMLVRRHFCETETSYLCFSERQDADYIKHMDAAVDILGDFADVRHEKMESYEEKGTATLEGMVAYAMRRYPECFARESADTDFSLEARREFGCAGKTYVFAYSRKGVRVTIEDRL